MKNKKTILLALAASLLFSTSNYAQADISEGESSYQNEKKHKKKNPRAMFKKLDTNEDDQLSRDEAYVATRLYERFDEIDTDGNDLLTHDELRAFHKLRREQRMQSSDHQPPQE